MGECGFEKLDVYQRALSFVDTVFLISEKFPKELQYSLGDQLRRAAMSIVNNIAEGSGSDFDKKKYSAYDIALCSTRECVPMISIMEKRNLTSKEQCSGLKEECIVICKMLTKLKQSVFKNKR